MCNRKIDNHVKIENKLECNVKKAYAMIFMELCSSNMQNIIEYHPKYYSILNYTLKIMGSIDQ